MITTIIGKTFLKAYNEKFKKNYSAKEFFENEYFELFFNHPKYMQWVTNSPFVQMKAGQKPELLSVAERKEKLENLFAKASKEDADASFAIGFPASESKEYASTSGLVSDIVVDTNEEDIYYSWIGSGLGIGVAGGYSLLIDDELILLETYEGWGHYRRYLNDSTLQKLRGNQINTWNGQWLTYKMGKDYDKNFKFRDLEDIDVFSTDKNYLEINTVNWSNLFFSFSNIYPNKTITAYIYSFGQTNKTIGFIPMYLKSGSELKQVFKQLYGSSEKFNNKDFQALYGMHIKRACELGSIGLQALRPEGLKKYMDEAKNFTFKKEEETIIYQSYKTWLIAMLSKNKQEITDYTDEVSLKLLDFVGETLNTDRGHLVDQMLETIHKDVLLNYLNKIIKSIRKEDLVFMKQLRNEIHLMTNEEAKYFNTLLRFDFTFNKRNKTN